MKTLCRFLIQLCLIGDECHSSTKNANRLFIGFQIKICDNFKMNFMEQFEILLKKANINLKLFI